MTKVTTKLSYVIAGSIIGLLTGSYLSGGIQTVGTTLLVVSSITLAVTSVVLAVVYFSDKEKREINEYNSRK